MRYDLTLPIKDLNGVQLTDASDPGGYTLRSVLVRTALFVDKGKLPSAMEKLAAYALAKRLASAEESVELSAEDVVFLKEQAGALWSPLVMGQVWELLEDNAASRRLRKILYTARGKPVAGIPSEG